MPKIFAVTIRKRIVIGPAHYTYIPTAYAYGKTEEQAHENAKTVEAQLKQECEALRDLTAEEREVPQVLADLLIPPTPEDLAIRYYESVKDLPYESPDPTDWHWTNTLEGLKTRGENAVLRRKMLARWNKVLGYFAPYAWAVAPNSPDLSDLLCPACAYKERDSIAALDPMTDEYADRSIMLDDSKPEFVSLEGSDPYNPDEWEHCCECNRNLITDDEESVLKGTDA